LCQPPPQHHRQSVVVNLHQIMQGQQGINFGWDERFRQDRGIFQPVRGNSQ
jgi:hypothetical protein